MYEVSLLIQMSTDGATSTPRRIKSVTVNRDRLGPTRMDSIGET